MKISSGTIMKWFGILIGTIPPLIMWLNIQYNLDLSQTQIDKISEMLTLWLNTVTKVECGSVGLVGIASNLKLTKE